MSAGNQRNRLECVSQYTEAELEALQATIPAARSGHRAFCDDDYFYIVGGFCRNQTDHAAAIFKEVWKLNLLTGQWKRFRTSEPFPTRLASFSLAQAQPFSSTFIVFGGSGTTFGNSSTNEAFLLHADKEDDKVYCAKIDAVGTVKDESYGQAMVAGEDGETFYIVGGTNGFTFNLDIHRLKLDGVSNQWRYEKLNAAEPEQAGRYRMEVVLDKEKLYIFGGGTPDAVMGFETVLTFDLELQKYVSVPTKPDANGAYPIARRCHSATQWNRDVIIVGGCSAEDAVQGRSTVYGDVWFFNLDTFTWRRHPFDLVNPVFFHAAAITKDGCLMVHGGTLEGLTQQRSKNIQKFDLGAMSLQKLAARIVYQDYQWVFNKTGIELTFTDAVRIVDRATNSSPDVIQGEEYEYDLGADDDFVIKVVVGRFEAWLASAGASKTIICTFALNALLVALLAYGAYVAFLG